MDPHDIRRWKENWDAVANVQQELARNQAPRSERAIRLSLAMIAAAGVRRPDPGRRAHNEEVRERWARLKAPWVR